MLKGNGFIDPYSTYVYFGVKLPALEAETAPKI